MKIISCIAVIGLHTFSRTGEPVFQICFLYCGFAIPTFFLVNGYLILRREPSTGKLLRKTGKYMAISFVWTTLFWVLDLVRHKETSDPIISTFNELFLQQGEFPHFWYLGALILVYLLVCTLASRLKQNKKLYDAITLISFFLMILVDIINLRRVITGSDLIQNIVPQALRLWTWVFYFFFFSKYNIERWKEKKWYQVIKKHKVPILAIILALFIGYQYFVGYMLLGINLPEYFYDNVFSILLSGMLFIIFKDLKLQNSKIQWIISELSSDILGIYIMHLLVKRVVVRFVPLGNIALQILVVILIFIGSAAVTSAMKRIPIVRQLVL